MHSKFIVFEGLDGSGLSTQSKLLAKYLQKKNQKQVWLTKEPTDSTIGKLIRAHLRKDKMNSKWLQTMFVKNRKEHVKEILKALREGKTVICDRYILSSIAYGSINTKIKVLQEMNKEFPKPNITILLKVPPKICLKRIKKSRGSFELFEHERKLKNVWYTYLEFAKKDNTIKVVDGTKKKSAVFRKIREIVENIYK